MCHDLNFIFIYELTFQETDGEEWTEENHKKYGQDSWHPALDLKPMSVEYK
jgi:hypothetical protein